MASPATPRAVEPPPPEAAPVDDPLVGRVLDDRYRVDSVLGEGGIGRVYRAMHLKLERPVALKVLHEGFRDAEDVRLRFEREAKTLSALRHPHIVTITDFGIADDMPYLVMELIEGRDLDALIESAKNTLPLDRVIGLMTQVLRSLAHAHTLGIIHRDLKPANALLQVLPDGTDHVEVLDFGLAKFIDDTPTSPASPKLTRAGTIVGTPAYMAPEQASAGHCDARTDVYAAGVMLFELVAGELPFLTTDPSAMLRAHMTQTPPKLRSLRPDASPALEALVARALDKDPAQRFVDGAAMLQALEAIAHPPERESATDAFKHTVQSLSAQVPERLRGVATDLRIDERLERLHRRLPTRLQVLPPRAIAGIVAGLVGLLLVVGVVSAFGGGDDDENEPPPIDVPAIHRLLPPLPADTPLTAVRQTADLPDARDPWQAGAGELPPELFSIKAQVDQGRRVSRRYMGSLRQISQQHPQDCRPKLVLARGYVLQRWLSHALPVYYDVFELDPSCRGEPAMLSSMLEMVRSEALEEEASRAVVRMYAREALEPARVEAARARRPVERARLERLVTALEAL